MNPTRSSQKPFQNQCQTLCCFLDSQVQLTN